MRADRLLSLLLLLQTRGRMTAQQLATELEVSERTIYRDIEALSTAGVPVYAECGPGGGCALLDSYRTNLTGLTEGEVQALFMLSIPAPLAELGVSQELKQAMLKLSAALPTSSQQTEAQVRQRIHLDSSDWSHNQEAMPLLHIMQQAIWQERMLQVTYRSWFETEFVQEVAPYGLVAKANVWHLVGYGNGRIRVIPAPDILAVQLDETPFTRPPDFDLVQFWQQWCNEVENGRSAYPVTLRVAPTFARHLAYNLHQQPDTLYNAATKQDEEGWWLVTIPFTSLEAARKQILNCGRGVEVLKPQALRATVLDFAQQIVQVYTNQEIPVATHEER